MVFRLIFGLIILGISLPAVSLEPVSSITVPATNRTLPGKISWIDLVTDAIRTAGEFYPCLAPGGQAGPVDMSTL